MTTIDKKTYDVIIIGAGASGLFCAVKIKQINPSLSVAIIEKQKTAGKKLLATGNGRCNLTNLNALKEMYHGSFSAFIDNTLALLSPEKLLKEFGNMGLLTTSDSEGRVYPLSKHSASVLNVLLLNCNNNGVDIITETFVKNITQNKSKFIVSSDSDEYICDKLVIATGSKATPETGADDSMLATLLSLGHTKTELFPALCPVLVNSKLLFNLKGVRVQGKVSITCKDKILKSEYGEIQFTEKALSGICLFNLARIANSTDNTKISIDLLPSMEDNEVLELLLQYKKRLSSDSLSEDLMCGIFQNKLSNALLKSISVGKDTPISNLSNEKLRLLAKTIKHWEFDVKKSVDFTRAQVVAGGINAREINTNSMESKLIKNMYIVGEIVDCDGDCGGLNLHFAFASAYCAAKNIAK